MGRHWQRSVVHTQGGQQGRPPLPSSPPGFLVEAPPQHNRAQQDLTCISGSRRRPKAPLQSPRLPPPPTQAHRQHQLGGPGAARPLLPTPRQRPPGLHGGGYITLQSLQGFAYFSVAGRGLFGLSSHQPPQASIWLALHAPSLAVALQGLAAALQGRAARLVRAVAPRRLRRCILTLPARLPCAHTPPPCRA